MSLLRSLMSILTLWRPAFCKEEAFKRASSLREPSPRGRTSFFSTSRSQAWTCWPSRNSSAYSAHGRRRGARCSRPSTTSTSPAGSSAAGFCWRRRSLRRAPWRRSLPRPTSTSPSGAGRARGKNPLRTTRTAEFPE